VGNHHNCTCCRHWRYKLKDKEEEEKEWRALSREERELRIKIFIDWANYWGDRARRIKAGLDVVPLALLTTGSR
jgi:hypothetical protein